MEGDHKNIKEPSGGSGKFYRDLDFFKMMKTTTRQKGIKMRRMKRKDTTKVEDGKD